MPGIGCGSHKGGRDVADTKLLIEAGIWSVMGINGVEVFKKENVIITDKIAESTPKTII